MSFHVRYEENVHLTTCSYYIFQKEQTKLRQQLDEALKNQHNMKLEQQNKLNEISAKQQQDVNIVEQLKKIVSDKEMKVKVLENEIQQLKLAVSLTYGTLLYWDENFQ